MGKALIYVDSNYWIYWLDSTLPEHPHVAAIMNEAIENGITTNYVTLLEVAHHIRGLPKASFSNFMESIQNLSTVVLTELDSQTVTLALRLLPDYASRGLDGRDCIILAAMHLADVTSIATHDRAFRAIRGIRVVDGIPARI